MIKKYIIVILALALATGAAGCTVTQASDKDQYGDYLTELNAGNTACSSAMDEYNTAAQYFSKAGYNQSIAVMSLAYKDYSEAVTHYQKMTGFADTSDQRAYADALKSYAESCKYAAAAYNEAYAAYGRNDRYKGDISLKDAADFIRQANQYHDKAVALQPIAIV